MLGSYALILIGDKVDCKYRDTINAEKKREKDTL